MPSKIPQKTEKGEVGGGVDEVFPERVTRGKKKTAVVEEGGAPGITTPAGAGRKADAPAYPASPVGAGVGLDVAKGDDGVLVGGIAVAGVVE
jgi:hypothetical protein